MERNLANIKRDELLKLPEKEITKVETYEWIIVVPTRRKHDSGWRLMALVGGKKVGKYYKPVEVIGHCDDINWKFPENMNHNILRSDMTLSNCLRFWSDYHKFRVGTCTSSTTIEIIECKNKDE